MPKRRAKGEGTYFKQAGRRYCQIQFTVNGQKHTETVRSEDEEEVRRILRERLAEVGTGISIDHRKLTFKDLAVQLVNYYKVRDFKYAADQIHRLDTHIMPILGSKKVIDILSADLEFIAAIRKSAGAANTEINHEIGIIIQAFRLAKKAGRIRIDPPFFNKLPEIRKRTTYWKDSEYKTLLKHLASYVQPIIRFMYYTGWRVSEVLSLQWRNIDWQRREIKLDPGTTKNKDPRTFPFIPELESLLREQLAEVQALQKSKSMIIPWIFHRNGNQIKDYRGQWYKACKACGFIGKKRHDFRSTAARVLRQYGFTEREIIKLVGWSEKSGQQMLAYYEVVTNEDLHERAKGLYQKAKGKKL